MKKIIILTCGIVLIVIAAIMVIAFCLPKKGNGIADKGGDVFDTNIASVVTIDINPSININLNKNNEVISVVPLNEDSKVVLEGMDYANKKIDDVLSSIMDNLQNHDYLNEENVTILINIDSQNNNLVNIVKDKINADLEEKKISANIIMQQVQETEELKEIAEKNNITISKAYYIQEQIKDDFNLSIEDFKDVSLSQIEEKINTYKEEENQSNHQENNIPSNSGNASNHGNVGVGEKSMQDLYDEGFMEGPQLSQIFCSKYGLSCATGFGAFAVTDRRCKYNYADQVEVVEDGYIHTAIMCNMTGDIYDYNKEQLIDMSQVIGEDRAWEIAINHILSTRGFTADEINDYSRYVSFYYQNTAPSNYVYYVHFTTKTQGEYNITMDAISGAIL